MREIFEAIRDWQQAGKKFALATVVKTYGSSPRPLGAKMAINEDLDFVGSVSGGCVEGNVIDNAKKAINKGQPVLLQYGISDETAWGFGLACGGKIEVFVEPLQSKATEEDNEFTSLCDFYDQQQLFVVATILTGKTIGSKFLVTSAGEQICHRITRDLAAKMTDLVMDSLRSLKPAKHTVEIESEEVEVFVDVFAPRPKLIIIGAVHIAIPMVKFACIMDFETYIVDPRSVYASRERFPQVGHLIVDWPAKYLRELSINRNTFFVFLSHDEKMDNPALKIALSSEAGYIGALGSRKTHARRVQALLEMGVEADQIERIHAPIGLDLGATTAEEIALSVIAEITAIRHAS